MTDLCRRNFSLHVVEVLLQLSFRAAIIPSSNSSDETTGAVLASCAVLALCDGWMQILP